MLSDRTIKEMMKKGDIIVTGELDHKQMQPVSIDLRLGGLLSEDEELFATEYTDVPYYMMPPGQFMLGCTLEAVGLSRNVVGQVHGKSTRARQGLMVHAAGLVDPGFRGQLTLELFNMSSQPVHLERGMLICQITFELLSTTPERLYGDPRLNSHYQNQSGPTPATLWP